MPITRRTVLRGVGTALALPYLEAMAPLSALAQTPGAAPVRMAFLFVPNGMDMTAWRLGEAGAIGELSPILSSLAPFKPSFSVLTGLAQSNAAALGDGPGDHARSTATWLTGVHIRKTAGTDIQAGISVDQLAAKAIGGATRFPSLELGCERSGMAGDCDSGYACAYSSNVSWAGPATPVAKEVSPRAVFERLFGRASDTMARDRRLVLRRSVLDAVLEDAARIRERLGTRDAQKLDEYFDGVRAVEKRLVAAEDGGGPNGAAAPGGTPRHRGEHVRLLGDMMVLAFQADLTRVSTLMFANEGSNRPYNEIGIRDGHHDVSHHGNDPEKVAKKRMIDVFHAEQLAYVLGRMASVAEADGRSLLENTMLVYGGGISDGNRHNHDDLPIVLAGGAGGTLKGGQHRVFAPGTPLTNLFVTMLDRVGAPVERLGDSTGHLRELTLF